MTEQELEDFLILRLLDEPVSHAERERASERSIAALDTVRDDGIGIEWVESQIMTNEEDEVTATLCHFKAADEDTLYEHAECAGLPVTQVHRRAQPVEGPYHSEGS